MSLTPLTRALVRATGTVHRGRELVVRVSREGLRLKHRKQRWTNALVLPWASAYDAAAKMRAAEVLRAREAKRQSKR